MARWVLAALAIAAGALRTTPPTQDDVNDERTKLQRMASSLDGLVTGETLSHSKIAPAIKVFANNLESVLASSKALKPADAMHQLLIAKAGISGLVKEMNEHQESLMRDDVDQRESVLLGVLMTHKADSMDTQLEILKSNDFKGLDVSRQLLRAHDNNTALYAQAAQYLDAHANASEHLVALSAEQKSAQVEGMASALEKRMNALEHQGEVRRIEHQKRMESLSALAKKGDKHAKSRIHHEERQYKKTEALNTQDVESMRAAVAAIRKGDMKALETAKAAITKSLEALKSKNGGMLVFLQRGNAYLERDCPFCVAQCVGKCHESGKPYTSCLTVCADSGK